MDLSDLDFEVVGTTTDIEAPQIDFNSVEVEPKRVTLGDTVNVSFHVLDESEIRTVGVKYESPITKKIKEATVIYNSEAKRYELQFEIDNTFESGVWEIGNTYLVDEHGNSSWDSSLDFSSMSFEVFGTNADVTPPTVDLESIMIDKKIFIRAKVLR